MTPMSRTSRPLLCELHAHTTWSDGLLTVRELVDLYGRAGFDVLAVTDHVVREPAPGCRSVNAGNFEVYLGEIEDEAERAWWAYGMLVLPGLELTDDDPRPERAAHVVAVGVEEFFGLEEGLDAALASARGEGALLIGAHPYALGTARLSLRGTARLASDPEWAREAVHRLELVNRHDFFHWVARGLFPRSQTETSISPSISGRGRQCSAARRSPTPCSSSCVRPGRSSSPGSTRPHPADAPRSRRFGSRSSPPGNSPHRRFAAWTTAASTIRAPAGRSSPWNH